MRFAATRTPDYWLAVEYQRTQPRVSHMPVGISRIGWDQPRHSPQVAAHVILNDSEMHDWLNDHYVGVQHLYEPHFGGPVKPFNFSQHIADINPDCLVGCAGQCNSMVGNGPLWGECPKNQLVLCADCGFCFHVRGHEWLTMDYMSGMATTEVVKFEEIEDMLD